MDKKDYNRVYAIKEMASTVNVAIDRLNIQGAENLIKYSCADLMHLEDFIHECSRCGMNFISKRSFKTAQIFCSADCRYNSTRADRKDKRMDKYERPVDLLRKTIYERMYRARRDGIDMPNADEIRLILTQLKVLRRKRNKMEYGEYLQQCVLLRDKYKTLIKPQ